MTEIKLNTSGSKVSVKITITQIIAAGYSANVYEKDSTDRIFKFSGTNVDNEHKIELPNNASDNIGRVISLRLKTTPLQEVKEDDKFSFLVEVFQGSKKMGQALVEKKLEDKVQTTNLTIKFKD